MPAISTTFHLPLRHSWAWALAACVVAATAEGLLAGGGVSARLSELVQPPFSPPLWVWAIIGVLYYILFFFLLKSLLGSASTPLLTSSALVLVAILLAANDTWNWLFFREKDLWHSTVFGAPYAAVALTLAFVLYRLRSPLFFWYSVYVAYLIYATWWGISLWRLNADVSKVG
ncbi:MAG: tryptophan-rich sensory protein [Armatimonadota bacterium]